MIHAAILHWGSTFCIISSKIHGVHKVNLSVTTIYITKIILENCVIHKHMRFLETA